MGFHPVGNPFVAARRLPPPDAAAPLVCRGALLYTGSGKRGILYADSGPKPLGTQGDIRLFLPAGVSLLCGDTARGGDPGVDFRPGKPGFLLLYDDLAVHQGSEPGARLPPAGARGPGGAAGPDRSQFHLAAAGVPGVPHHHHPLGGRSPGLLCPGPPGGRGPDRFLAGRGYRQPDLFFLHTLV